MISDNGIEEIWGSDAEFKAAMILLHPTYPEIIDAQGDFIHRPILDPEQREARTEEQRAVRLQDRAAKFAQSLIEAVPVAERVKLAAPPPKSKRAKHVRCDATGFDARHPSFVEARHGPFRDCGDRKFAETALRLGHSVQVGNAVRAELVLIYLVRGEQPPYAVVDGRQKYPRSDEAPISAALFPLLWEAHERALVEAEQRQLTRLNEPSPLRSQRAQLLSELFEAMTLVKLGGRHVAMRMLLKVLGRVIEEYRREIAS